ncbi:hypothetical protein ACXR2W_09105 [Leucobacter sp. HY1908]
MALARTEPFVVALACVDHLLHHEFSINNVIDVSSWRHWQSELSAVLRATPRSAGNLAVRALLEFANPASASPLESVSKLRMLQLGIDFELQKRVQSPGGRWWYIDFWFPGQQRFGECDGRAKYADEVLRQGRSADDIVYAEKRRQNAIEGITRTRGVRWGASEVETRDTFAKMCTDYGITFLGRPLPSLDRRLAQFLLMQP